MIRPEEYLTDTTKNALTKLANHLGEEPMDFISRYAIYFRAEVLNRVNK